MRSEGDGAINTLVDDNTFDNIFATSAKRGVIEATVAGAGTFKGNITANRITDSRMIIETRGRGMSFVVQDESNANLNIDGNTIDGVGQKGIFIQVLDRARQADVRITNNFIGHKTGDNSIRPVVDEGLEIQVKSRDDFVPPGIPANFLIHNNEISGLSGDLDFDAEVDFGFLSVDVNLIVTGNTFAGSDFNTVTVNTEDAAATLRLHLDNNEATGFGSPDFVLTEGNGTFTVQDFAGVTGRNLGVFSIVGGITDNGGIVAGPAAAPPNPTLPSLP